MLLARKPLIFSSVTHLLVLGFAFFMPLPQPMKKPDQPLMVSLVQGPSPKRPQQPPTLSLPVVKVAMPTVEPVVIPTKPTKTTPPPPPVKTTKTTPPPPPVKTAKTTPPPPVDVALPPPVKTAKTTPPPPVDVALPPPVKTAKPPPPIKTKKKPLDKPQPVAIAKPRPKPTPEPKVVKRVKQVKQVKQAKPVKKVAPKSPEPRKSVEAKNNKEKPTEPVQKKPEALDFSAAIAKLQVNRPVRTPKNIVTEFRADSRTIDRWQRTIQNKIYANWNKPSGLRNERNLAVTVMVKVAPDGTLENPRISRTSGHAIFDNSVLRAIQKTATVERSPKGCPECQELEITFRPERE